MGRASTRLARVGGPPASGRGPARESVRQAGVGDRCEVGGADAELVPGSPGSTSIRRCFVWGDGFDDSVTADRGYGEAAVQKDLEDLGVSYVAIPRKGKTSQARRQVEHRRAFQVKWRTGCEGRISHLKRTYGWNRT